MRSQLNASEVRTLILREYRKAWEEIGPANEDYMISQSVWNLVWPKIESKVDPGFANSVLRSLFQDELLEGVAAPDPAGKETHLSRITTKGLAHLSEKESIERARRLAVIGAVTGSLGLLTSVVQIWLG